LGNGRDLGQSCNEQACASDEWGVANRPAENHLLAAQPDDAIALLQPDLRQIPLPPGSVCYSAWDPIDRVYFPHGGMISLVIVADGEMVETSSIGCEGAVGLQSGFGPRLWFTRAMQADTLRCAS
jgi:hypothetical protein